MAHAAEVGLFSRLPELIVFRAIKTGICSPGWRQNNSNKTKWPMSSRLNNVLCVRQHMDFGNEFENCFPRFDKMVGKVSDTKTIADSLWQGYNVSCLFWLCHIAFKVDLLVRM